VKRGKLPQPKKRKKTKGERGGRRGGENKEIGTWGARVKPVGMKERKMHGKSTSGVKKCGGMRWKGENQKKKKKRGKRTQMLNPGGPESWLGREDKGEREAWSGIIGIVKWGGQEKWVKVEFGKKRGGTKKNMGKEGGVA